MKKAMETKNRGIEKSENWEAATHGSGMAGTNPCCFEHDVAGQDKWATGALGNTPPASGKRVARFKAFNVGKLFQVAIERNRTHAEGSCFRRQ